MLMIKNHDNHLDKESYNIGLSMFNYANEVKKTKKGKSVIDADKVGFAWAPSLFLPDASPEDPPLKALCGGAAGDHHICRCSIDYISTVPILEAFGAAAGWVGAWRRRQSK